MSSTPFCLCQAGLFSAISTAFIVQIIPSIQPNPSDLTNVLLLRILQQNNSFGGSNPLAPVTNVSPGLVRAQSILFASLAVTLFVAFIAVLGKQWILYYKRASTWGSIVDRGKERQVKFAGLQKWGLLFIVGLLPVLLHLALLLFGIGLTFYLWDIDLSTARVTLVVTCIGCAFYTCIAVAAAIWSDCPFKTPVSHLLLKIFRWANNITTYFRVRLGQWSTVILQRIERAEGCAHRVALIKCLCKTFGAKATPDQAIETVYDRRYTMKISNPAFWREDPLFTSPPPKDTTASAAFWLLENSTDFSSAAAVAAVFYEFQWPSRHNSTTALIRLRDAYTQCFRAPVFDRSARLKALQSAAAYYILYHTRLIWSTSKSGEVQVEKLPSDLPPDLLLLHEDSKEWNGYDLFEYLLRINDRPAPVESARFLSYIAPYWFCGDSGSTIRLRSSRLETLDELIDVLESSKALVPATLTDCVLCVGVAMDFPLHPEDLIRVNKRYVPHLGRLRMTLTGNSNYLSPTFKMVVEHILHIILAGSRRHDHALQALEVLITLVNHTNLPLVDAAWMNELLKRAAKGHTEGEMADEHFNLFLRLSARRTDSGDATVDTEVGDFVFIQGFEADQPPLGIAIALQDPMSDNVLFSKITGYVQACAERGEGWQNEAIYGGLVAIRDILRLKPSLFDDNTLQMFHEAMDGASPLHVRQAAYDATLVTQDQWLKPERLRQKLEDRGFFRQLHSVVVEVARPDYKRSFLMTMEALSKDLYWHSYLREAMEIWLPLRRNGQDHTLRIIANIGGLPPPKLDGHNSPSFEEFLQKLVVDGWVAVPGRRVGDLTADRLKPLVEVTERFMELLFLNADYWEATLAAVGRVIPDLEQRRDNSLGEDVRSMMGDLLTKLRLQP